MAAEKEFYTVKEVANIIGVSTDRVYEWLRSGYIKGTRPMPHSAWRVHESELTRLRGEIQKRPGAEEEQHLTEIRTLLEVWRRELGWFATSVELSPCHSEGEKLFPFLLQHCPSLVDKHNTLKEIRKDSQQFFGDLKCFIEQVHKVYHEKVLPLVEFLSEIPGLDDIWLEFGDPVAGYFYDSTESYLLGPFALRSYDSAEAPFDDFLAHYGRYLDADDTAEIRQAWQDAQAEFFKESSVKNSAKERMLRYLKTVRDAQDGLKSAVDTSLLSHEYLRHRCDWCP